MRLVESGDEVLVTYGLGLGEGRRGRNTEVLGFRGERSRSAEVYFGWELPLENAG